MTGRRNFLRAYRFVVRSNATNKVIGLVRALTPHQAYLVAESRHGKRITITPCESAEV